MTTPDLEVIENRVNAATEGPWDEKQIYVALRYFSKCWMGDDEEFDDEKNSPIYHGKDPAFIAASRTDVPDLIAEIRRLRESDEGERLLRSIVKTTQGVPLEKQSPEILDIALSIESHIGEFEKERADAAGECVVPLPEVGSDLGKVVSANSLLRKRIAELESIVNPEWHTRDEMPPPSTGHPDPDSHFPKLWASDGKDVWEIWNRDEAISDEATRVKFWAVKRYPDPPAPTGDKP